MHRRTLRRLSAIVLTSAALASAGAITAPPVSADPISQLQSGGVGYVIFVVKDLGGGAYWNVTTHAMYALATGSAALVGTAQTGAELMATLAADGRDLLLLVNGAVLVPVTDKLTNLL
jgi:hypothetical protein